MFKSECRTALKTGGFCSKKLLVFCYSLKLQCPFHHISLGLGAQLVHLSLFKLRFCFLIREGRSLGLCKSQTQGSLFIVCCTSWFSQTANLHNPGDDFYCESHFDKSH